MTDPQLTILASLAGAAVVLTGVALARRPTDSAGSWPVVIALAAAFAGFSVHAVLEDGPLGFWREHTSSPWGTQIWLDLLLGIGTAWFLLLPRLRACGLNPLPWLALVVATGSIGLLAVLARTLRAEAGGSRDGGAA